MNRLRAALPLLALVALALGLRLWGIDRHLPDVRHPDEPLYVNIILGMWIHGDPNPHFFNYPSLFFYLHALAYVPFSIAARLLGAFAAPGELPLVVSQAMGVAMAPVPATILLGRTISALAGAALVAVTYAAGRRLTGRAAVGWLAAAMVALSPTHVTHSRWITPDIFVTLFATATLWAAAGVLKRGRQRDYLLAGACVGLTASCKYNGGLVVTALLLAWAMRPGRGPHERGALVRALFVSGAAFLATTPFALLDPRPFLSALRYESRHYATGHAGMEGDTWGWYLRYMAGTAPVLYLLAAAQALRGIAARSRETVVLAGFPIVYLAFIGSFVVRNDRTLLPATPFVFVLAAGGLVWLHDRAGAWAGPVRRRAARLAVAALAAAGLATPAAVTVGDGLRLAAPDGRDAARAWIMAHVPAGAAIALESYAPFIDPARYRVRGMLRAIDQEPSWFVAEGIDFVVVSQGMFGRFLDDPDRHPEETAAYRRLFAAFDLAARFQDNGFEVRVYRVGRGE